MHTLLESVAVPTLPDGCCAVIDRVEPARILALEEQITRNILHTVLGECRHQDRCTEETCLQAVVVLLEVLAQTRNHIRLSLTLNNTRLECEECRGLHSVENRGLECAVSIEELRLYIALCAAVHRLIVGSIATCCGSHICHHRRIHSPIGCAEEVPVTHSLRVELLCTLDIV